MAGSRRVKAPPVAQPESCIRVIFAYFNDSLPRRRIVPDSRQQGRERLLPHNLCCHDRQCMPPRKRAKAEFFADISLGDCHVRVPPVVWVARSSLSHTSVLRKIATSDSSLLKDDKTLAFSVLVFPAGFYGQAGRTTQPRLDMS